MQKETYSCDCNIIHEEAVDFVRERMPDDAACLHIANYFKLLGDPTRMRIIWALDMRELCVCDLANVLNMTKSAVSHQLSLLREARLVKWRRDGKNVFYTLMDDHVRGMFESALEHMEC